MDPHAGIDLVVLDRFLEPDDGLDLILELRGTLLDVPVVMFTGDRSIQTVTRALSLGAMGFVPKHFAPPRIAEAIGFVLSGGVFVPRELLLAKPRPRSGQAEAAASFSSGQMDDLRALGLSAREVEVLRLLTSGKPNKVIARQLNIAESTVKTHVSVILKVLQASNRSEAIHIVTNEYYRK